MQPASPHIVRSASFVWLAMWVWAAPLEGGVQDPASEPCFDGQITAILIDRHSVFDTDQLSEGQRFRWALDLANSLHMRTREDFIRSEILVREGDCYQALRVQESGRLLRGYSFISLAEVTEERQPDGNWHVLIETTDEWTTELNVRFNFEEGVEFRGVDLTEEHLLGRGILVGAFLSQKDERRDVGGRIASPRLFGTRLNGFLQGGGTRVGGFFQEQLFYPFVAEFGRWAGRQLFSRREDQFNYRTEGGSSILLPVESQSLDITLARRIGRPGNLTIFGFGLARQTLEYPDFPNGVERSLGGNFGDTEPVGSDITDRIEPQTDFASATRLNFLIGQRSLRFEPRRGLDALTGIQDVPLGWDLGLTLGKSLAGSTTSGELDDLYTRIRLFGGATSGAFLFNAFVAAEGRQLFANTGSGTNWRDVIAEFDGVMYVQPEGSAHTLLGRAAYAGAWRMTLPYQLTLGGSAGVRGFREERFPGSRRMVFSVEDRVRLGWPATRIFDSGFTLFADVGRIWAGEAPFGTDSGWKGSLGLGLRIGFPAGTSGVTRIDLAFPVEGGGISSPVFRLTLLDLLGLSGLLRDPQLQRSRLNSVGPDLFSGPG